MAVWRVDRPEGGPLDGRLDVLDDEERRRADRFVHEADRRRYRTAHVALRLVLGGRLGIEPEAVRLGRAPCPLCGAGHGRPVVLDDPTASFSLTHCPGLVLVAVHERTVGVDAEPVDRTELDALDAALHPDERAALAAVTPGDRRHRLVSCWARKEAYLKGLGTGLGIDPATVAVGLDAGPTRIDDWTVLALPSLDPGHVGGLAIEVGTGVVPDVVVRSLDVRPG